MYLKRTRRAPRIRWPWQRLGRAIAEVWAAGDPPTDPWSELGVRPPEKKPSR